MLGRLKFILIYLRGRRKELEKKKIIGANVTKFRKLKNLQQEDLARESGLSTDEISKIERGVANPTLTSLEQIAKILGIDIEELFLERAFILNLALSEKTIYDLKRGKEFLDELLKRESKKE